MSKCMNCGHDAHCGVRLFREEKDDKGLLSKENLAMMSVVGIFAALVMAALLFMMNQ